MITAAISYTWRDCASIRDCTQIYSLDMLLCRGIFSMARNLIEHSDSEDVIAGSRLHKSRASCTMRTPALQGSRTPPPHQPPQPGRTRSSRSAFTQKPRFEHGQGVFFYL